MFARKAEGLTQAQVAERMGTKAPSVARLENAQAFGKHSPSVETLSKYADALGKKLEVHLVWIFFEKHSIIFETDYHSVRHVRTSWNRLMAPAFFQNKIVYINEIKLVLFKNNNIQYFFCNACVL